VSEWLCESCKYRKGKLRPTSTYDTCGTRYSYTGSMKVFCTAHKSFPVRDAVKSDPYYAIEQCCMDYKKKRGQ